MKYKPHNYQIFAADFVKSHPITALVLDMGLGKSVITLTAIYDLLKRYESWRTATSITCEYFFVNESGENFGNNWMWLNVRKCWRRANPEIKPDKLSSLRAYDFRHRFATENIHRWMGAKANLNQMLQYLKVYMGHTELKHTAYYMHILPEKLAKSPGVNWELLDSLIPEVSVWEN